MPVPRWSQQVPPLLVWAAAWALMLALDEPLALANKALLLVLAAAVAALWWPPQVSVPACAAAVLAFDYSFVPPRHTLRVDLQHDALLLTTMLAVSTIVALLMARQRRLATLAREQALRAEQLHALAESLRAAEIAQAAAAAAAREAAQAQALRNTLLAAIAHDHRTPLATILGAAGSLHDQGERLSAPQRRHLAATIVDEASQLARLTDNTLQLARLESGQPTLHRDWESAEEIVGTALRRARQRHAHARLRSRVRRGLPLLRCDALLLQQLLDNLVDNALKYGGTQATVELLACRWRGRMVFAVRDRGPGVPAHEREQVFAAFQRGSAAGGGDAPVRRGAGVGLALCRAIAHAHGGTLGVRDRRGGGASFELVLPLEPAPVAAA